MAAALRRRPRPLIALMFAFAAAASWLAVPVAADEVSGKVFRVTPLPIRWGYDTYPKEFGISVLDDTNAAGEPESIAKKQVRKVDHFEQIALEETDKLLKLGADGPKEADRLEAAE